MEDPAGDLTRHDGKPIAALDFEIQGRVDASALRRNLHLTEGRIFDAAIWRNDLQQLMNRGVFSRIETRANSEGGAVHLSVCAETNWSLLPYIGAQTGAVPILILGVNHGNLLGELVEGGGYYMRRGPHDLGRAWLVLPNVVTSDSLLDLELVMTGELMSDYPSALDGPDPLAAHYVDAQRYRWSVPSQGQEVLRRGMFADFGYQLIPEWLLLSTRYVLLFETRYRLPNLRSVVDAENRELAVPELQRSAADYARLSMLSWTVRIGGINLVDNYRYLGSEAQLVVAASSKLLASAREFVWTYATTRHFVNLAGRFDFGGRLTYAHSTSRDRRDAFNLGGYNLEPFVHNERNPGVLTVRGFRESHFAGRNIAFVNLEPRYHLFHDIQLPWIGAISLTLAGYVDAGHAWQRSDQALDDVYVSVGGGALLSLQNFRYTFLNWYYAHTFSPYPSDVFSVFVTRPFF